MVPEYALSLVISFAFTGILYLWRKPKINLHRLAKLLAIEALIAFIWDLIAVARGWWSFIHPDMLLGPYVLWLPVEEIFFFVAVTLGVIVMWESLG